MPDPYARARRRAAQNIQVKVRYQPVLRGFQRMARRSPNLAKRAMAFAVTEWHRQTIIHIPVRASRRRRGGSARGPSLFLKVGRGQLKQRTSSFVRGTGTNIIGGIISDVHYAIWLMAGTRRIAGGRVMRWRPGMPPIRSWPAKRMGGNPAAEMPIIIPYRPRAIRVFQRTWRQGLRREWRRGA